MLDKTIRCDNCGSEAWVSVKKDGMQLDFCGHHYASNSIMLHAGGWAISQDERDTINSKPSISASV